MKTRFVGGVLVFSFSGGVLCLRTFALRIAYHSRSFQPPSLRFFSPLPQWLLSAPYIQYPTRLMSHIRIPIFVFYFVKFFIYFFFALKCLFCFGIFPGAPCISHVPFNWCERRSALISYHLETIWCLLFFGWSCKKHLIFLRVPLHPFKNGINNLCTAVPLLFCGSREVGGSLQSKRKLCKCRTFCVFLF